MQRASQASINEEFTLIRLTRNFGQPSALLVGYEHANGDCTISMSADLQDPPKLTPIMFQNWLKGAKLVIGTRLERNDGFFNNLISNFAWSILREFAIKKIPKGGFDYFLMDSELRNDIVESSEHNFFLQGRLLFYGYDVVYLDYVRDARPIGKSQTTFLKKVKFFIDAMASSTFLPIRIVSIFGILIFILSLIAILAIVWAVLINGTVVKGWASIMTAILFFSGIQMLSIGILGEYIWRGLEESRKRSRYKIKEIKNFTNKI